MFVFVKMKGLSKAEAKKQLEYWFDWTQLRLVEQKKSRNFREMAQKISLSFVFCTFSAVNI
jgi:ABC-type uncharacterized transport system ATPase subunit